MEILYPRHGKNKHNNFGYILDRITFSIKNDFENVDDDAIVYLRGLSSLQRISNRLIVNLQIKEYARYEAVNFGTFLNDFNF